jgi:hypothetical protein
MVPKGRNPHIPLRVNLKLHESDYQGRLHNSRKRLVVSSVRLPAWKISAPTGRIFMKFYISGFFEKLPRKFGFY